MMTPRQRSDFDRLTKRVQILERRNAELLRATVPLRRRLDHLRWLVSMLEELCPQPYMKGQLRVSHSDFKAFRQLLIDLDPTLAISQENRR